MQRPRVTRWSFVWLRLCCGHSNNAAAQPPLPHRARQHQPSLDGGREPALQSADQVRLLVGSLAAQKLSHDVDELDRLFHVHHVPGTVKHETPDVRDRRMERIDDPEDIRHIAGSNDQ